MRSASQALLILSSLTISLFPLSVLANPIKTVGTAVVNKGAHTIEARSGFSFDDKSAGHDGRFQTRQFYDYGLTDSFALRLTAIQDDLGTNSFEHSMTMVDGRVQLFERKDHGFDGGFRMTYMLRDGDKKPDVAELRWINHFYFGEGYEFRHHIIAQHQVGEDKRSGIMPELRWQITRPLVGKHRAGLEMFNEFGNVRDQSGYSKQSHDAGFVVAGPIWKGLRYQTGYRHSLSSNAPDHAVKFFVGYDF
jgi:hypothetical protein